MIGRTLSHYRILEKLGAGGMGEVYRARDEKLGRDVAVKVLPPGLLANEAARARFRKEALALSRLSHPHIATLLDFDSEDGTDFLVMELVEGKTLLEAVREGPLSEKEVVRLGSQLARGLQAAHEHGVIHRDLKPGNLALTPDGLLKVLDFGLARLERLTLPEVGEKTASTDTAVGHVVGTPAYMAPEQLRGKGVDARTDVYGAGACLYELATGRRPFGGKSGVELTDAVLHEGPVTPRSVSGAVSPGLEAVILKALDKDQELRYQTAKELLVDLERLQVAGSSTSGARPEPTLAEVGRRRRRRRLTLAASTTAVAGLLVAGGFWFLKPPANPRILNARPLTGGLSPQLLTGDTSCWATDGVRIFFFGSKNGQAAFFQVPMTGGEPVELPRPPFSSLDLYGYLSKESALLLGGLDSRASAPAVPGQVGEPLWVVPLPGGPTSRVGSLWAVVAAISPDEEQLALVERNSILIVRRDGSKVRELTSLPPPTGRIDWAPDGKRLRFDAVRAEGGEPWIWEVPVEGGSARPLWPGERGRWTKDGRYFVFQRWSRPEARRDLWAVREPRFRWLPLSTPVRLTVGPVSFSDVGPAAGDRRLLAWGTTNRGELLRFDAKTGRFESYLGGASAYYVSSSADGQWLAWVSYPDGALWRSRPDGTERLRLTPPGWEAHLPRWSPDGRSLVFAGKGPTEGLLSIVRTTADANETEVLARSDTDADLWDPCWLPDGRTILYSHRSVIRLGIYRLDLQTQTRSILPGAEELRYPKCSSRGNVLAQGKPGSSSAGVGLPYSVFLADQGTWEPLGGLPLAHPNWLPDGQSFIGLNLTAMRLERWSRATRRLEPVADLRDLPLVTWVRSPWTGLGPDGSPLVTRDLSTRDLYALDWEAP